MITGELKNKIDTSKMKNPAFLMVLTSTGKYAYKEISVPTGVKIDSKIKTFEITSKNRSVKVEVKNDYSKGVLNIEKVEKGTGKPLEGIV